MNNLWPRLAMLIATIASTTVWSADLDSFAAVNRFVQDRSVKIYGAGGLRQLEAYQSGILVSKEGHVATVASLVLDQDEATVVLGDGRRYDADVIGLDRVREVAVLKIDGEGESFPYFDLNYHSDPHIGMRLFAFSNLYNVATGDEPVSVLHGSLAAIAPLEARRGAFATRFRGEVYVLDAATNNPGAAGGVVVDLEGRPLGMIGKEVRSEVTGTWLNYALPLPQLAAGVEQIISGESDGPPATEMELPERPVTFASLGFRLVPDVVARTPPFIDTVAPNSPAATAELRPNDLLVAIGGQITGSCGEVELALSRLPIDQPLNITVLRDEQLIDVQVTPREAGAQQ